MGASGYTGGELLRLLAGHPYIHVISVTGDKSVGQTVSALFPNLSSHYFQALETTRPLSIPKEADIVFLALPHTQSMEPAVQCLRQGKLVLDLSADFRLKDPQIYQEWYQVPHTAPKTLNQAVYGLPELYRTKIRKARLVAVPGCYPTAAILQLAPLIAKGFIKPGTIVIDAKSGISGAGRSPALPFHFPESHESVKAYKIGEHRHTPEIEQELSKLFREHKRNRFTKNFQERVTFTPHLIPLNRGILSTAYAKLAVGISLKQLQTQFTHFFKKERFIRIKHDPLAISPSYVHGSNFCDMGVFLHERTGQVVTVAALDNLVKGAAGQAIQSMNIMVGFPEETGLDSPGIYP